MNTHRFLRRAALSASLFVSAVSLTGPCLTAQERGRVAADEAGTFYKAFYLARGARRFDQAAGLYREFLAAQPDHALAATAARELHGLLMRTGKRKEAAAARKEFAPLFRTTIDTPTKEAEKTEAEKKPAKAESKQANQGAESAKPKADKAQANKTKEAGSAPSAEMKARIARLAKELKAATEAGDDQRALMLEAQLERAKKRAGRTSGSAGSGGRSGGGFAARASQIDFSKMDDRAAAQMVERMEAMRGRMVGRLDEKTRAQVDAKWAALRKHIDGGDKASAQKLWVELRTMLFRRR